MKEKCDNKGGDFPLTLAKNGEKFENTKGVIRSRLYRRTDNTIDEG